MISQRVKVLKKKMHFNGVSVKKAGFFWGFSFKKFLKRSLPNSERQEAYSLPLIPISRYIRISQLFGGGEITDK